MKFRIVAVLVFAFAFSAISISHAFTDLCVNFLKQGKFDEAIEECTKQIKGEKNTDKLPLLYGIRGAAYESKGQLDRAIADYSMAIKLNPRFADAYNYRGAAYESKGQLNPAIADFTEAIELNPEFANAYNNRGSTYRAKGQYDQAIADYTMAIKLNPKFSQAYRTRGSTYRAKGQYDQAIADYNKVIDLNQKDDYAYLGLLITTWLSKGKDSGAIKRFHQDVASNPSDEWVRTISRYYLGIGGVNEKSVLEEAKKSRDDKERQERLCEAYFYLGAKRLAEGNNRGAVEYFTKSIETGVKDFAEYYESQDLLTLIKKGKI